MTTTRSHLLEVAQKLCNDFASQEDVDTLLSHFTTSSEPEAIEYGEAVLAPFLGKKFTGIEGIREYFGLISQLLSYENMRFSEFIVDVEERKVAVKGQATFTWVSTRESWDETFHYALDFDEGYKLKRYQVWADSGATYLSRVGKLNSVRHTEGELQ